MTPADGSGLLIFDERTIRRHGPGNLLRVCWRQWRAERALARRGVEFRTTSADAVAHAYEAMSEAEFDAINGRQDWANWRTIPRALSGQVPNRPLRVLDLGCGTGASTRVLAFYCPAGSEIIGYEMAAGLVEIARRRKYVHTSGQPVKVSFCCQSITESLRQTDGSLLADRSVDVVNASGIVGHHLNPQTVRPLVQELKRVLVPGGIAMLDVGPTLGEVDLTAVMTGEGFEKLGRWRSWILDPTGEVVFMCMSEPRTE
jgi:SAM-dependent methyltransferase